MNDLKNAIDLAQSLAPAARTATANGTGVDTANFNSVTAVFECGALTDGVHTPVLQDSDNNSTFADVTAANLVGTLAVMTANSIQRVGYLGTKRYVRCKFTTTGATTGAVTGAMVIGSHLRKAPV